MQLFTWQLESCKIVSFTFNPGLTLQHILADEQSCNFKHSNRAENRHIGDTMKNGKGKSKIKGRKQNKEQSVFQIVSWLPKEHLKEYISLYLFFCSCFLHLRVKPPSMYCACRTCFYSRYDTIPQICSCHTTATQKYSTCNNKWNWNYTTNTEEWEV